MKLTISIQVRALFEYNNPTIPNCISNPRYLTLDLYKYPNHLSVKCFHSCLDLPSKISTQHKRHLHLCKMQLSTIHMIMTV